MRCLSLPSDINECAINGSHNCHKHANCSNVVGSFNCSCLNGFTGNGTFCEGELSSDILLSLCYLLVVVAGGGSAVVIDDDDDKVDEDKR